MTVQLTDRITMGAAAPGVIGEVGMDLATGRLLIYVGGVSSPVALLSEVSGGGAWSTSGGNVFLTTSTDQVGIGTASPGGKLHVLGDDTTQRTAVFQPVAGQSVPTVEVQDSAGNSVFNVRTDGEVELTANLHPTSGGRLARFGADLEFHNGTLAVQMAGKNVAQTFTEKQTFGNATLAVEFLSEIQLANWGHPTAGGRLSQFASDLEFHDGTAARVVAFVDRAQTFTALQTLGAAGQSAIIGDELQFSNLGPATAAGRLRQNSNHLSFHDGTSASDIAMLAAGETVSGAWTFSAKPLFSATLTPSAEVARSIVFQNWGAAPSAGELTQNSGHLSFHTGVAASDLAMLAAAETVSGLWTFSSKTVFNGTASQSIEIAKSILFQNWGSPTTTGELSRSGDDLEFFTSVAAVKLAYRTAAQAFTGKQSFTPDATFSGLNVGSVGSDPSTLADGDLWYNSGESSLKVQKGGATLHVMTSSSPSGGANAILQGGNAFGATVNIGTTDTQDLQLITGNVVRVEIDSTTGYVGIGTTGGSPTSRLENGGSFAWKRRDVSSGPVTLDGEDCFVSVDATSGAITVNLPTASGIEGRVYIVKKRDASGNAVTVDPSGAETIDGASTKTLASQWDTVRIISDGTNWLEW